MSGFDWKNPEYVPIFEERLERLKYLRKNPKELPALRLYYKDHIPQFISDWGCTFDPRNLDVGQPAVVPFLLFPRQVDWIEWAIDSWKHRRPGVTPKSRESGVSWLAVAMAVAMCEFYDGMVIGFGSRKAEYVDKIGQPKSLFWKARMFRDLLPAEFKGGYDPKIDAPEMRMQFRRNGSYLTGEGGDSIGRGDRTTLYFVDESAHLEHPDSVDQALSQTTNCRIDVSTAYGLGGPFHNKVMKWPKDRVFRFHWRDDPRKDQAWYDKQVAENDPVTVAQEIDIDFAASVEGVLIPSAWVQAAIDADIKLGISPSGAKSGALDVADEGKDNNAFCGGYGTLVEYLEEWSGRGGDIFQTTQKAFGYCDEWGYHSFRYDADGLGAGVRGDANVINGQRTDAARRLTVEAYRGSASVENPEKEDVKGRKNKDFFANFKAQSWWSLRNRFLITYRAVVEKAAFKPDDIISLRSSLKLLDKLTGELSQPTYSINSAGKVVVDKAPEGFLSPNLADSVVIRFAPMKAQLIISPEVLQRSRQLASTVGGHRR